MKISDRLTGIFLAVLGLATFWGGSRFPPVPGQQVGPSAFPMVIGAGLILVGAMIALHIGRGFEEAAEAELAKHSVPDPEAEAFTASRRWYALLPPGLMVFYYFLSERLGFVLTATIMIAVLASCFGARLKHVIPVSILGALGIYYVFIKVLRVPLASGLLPLPW
jgi:putative tricarboxylic transport membrane protein